MTEEKASRAARALHDVHRQVRLLVTELFARGNPDIRRVANALEMGTRTLQRRLGDVGLTYAQVMAEARADMARRMLADPARKIGDVARALGYSDAAHFSRAFLRWTGVTPRQFRSGRMRPRAARAPRRGSAHIRRR